MESPNSFVSLELENRLGQTIKLAVQHVQFFGREYVFVKALTQQVSSLVAKNAEHFAFQLREAFQLDARRFEMIEVRGFIEEPNMWRWRFEWVGTSPISPRCEAISGTNQQTQMRKLLNTLDEPQVALG